MIRWASGRPAVVWASVVALLLTGAVAFQRLPLSTRSVVELPRLRIAAAWPGASAELVERYVTAPIEAAVQGVRGVRRVDSESQDGDATLIVTLHGDAGVPLSRLAVLERLELLRGELPSGVSAPTVSNYVPDELAEQPLLRYTLAGPFTPGAVAALAHERIAPRVGAVPGVAGVSVSGGAEPGIAVTYDPARLRQLGLAPDGLTAVLAGARLTRPLGVERAAATVRPVLLSDPPLTLAGLAATPVAGSGGPRARVLALGDLASVRPDEDTRGISYRVNGVPAVTVSIARLPGADAIRTGAAVRAVMADIAAALPPAVVVRLQADESRALARQLRALTLRGAIALVVVVGVLAAGLRDARAVGLVALTCAVAVAGTTLSLYLLRVPASLLTLAALAMGIGILVQNGIVVVDRLRGLPDAPAARADAARRIAPAVLGATLTTAAVLLPFLYLQGNARAAFVPFAAAFTLALGWSVVAAIVMLPAVAPHFPARARGRTRAGRAYARLAVRLVRWRWPVLALTVAGIAVVGWGFATKVPRWSFGRWYAQRATLYAAVSFPRGSDPAGLDRAIREFEQIAVGRAGVEEVTVRGDRSGAVMVVAFTRDAGLVPYLLEEELTRRAILIGGAAVSVRYEGPGFSSGYGGGAMAQRIRLLGYSYDGLLAIAEDLKARLERMPRVRDVDVNAGSFWWRREKGYDVVIAPDRAALARYGLTSVALARALGREVRGQAGSQRLAVDGAEVPVALKAAGAAERTVDQLRAALVPAPGGAPVRIGDVAWVGERETVDRISRQDQQYVRILSYEFRGPPRLAERTHGAFMRSISLPPGYSASDDAFRWDDDESARGLWLVFTVGVVLVALVVAIVFDSVWGTAMVVAGLPVALAGAAAAFWIAGATFSREASVGVVLVVGLAVNQIILLVDAALERRRRHGRAVHPLSAAQVVAVARDRAGMITLVTLATLASLVPMALGTDPEQLFGAIALASLGGSLGGTLAALCVVPVLLSGASLAGLR